MFSLWHVFYFHNEVPKWRDLDMKTALVWLVLPHLSRAHRFWACRQNLRHVEWVDHKFRVVNHLDAAVVVKKDVANKIRFWSATIEFWWGSKESETYFSSLKSVRSQPWNAFFGRMLPASWGFDWLTRYYIPSFRISNATSIKMSKHRKSI